MAPRGEDLVVDRDALGLARRDLAREGLVPLEECGQVRCRCRWHELVSGRLFLLALRDLEPLVDLRNLR